MDPARILPIDRSSSWETPVCVFVCVLMFAFCFSLTQIILIVSEVN